MGKKNKASRRGRRGDDDLLLGPETSDAGAGAEDDGDVANDVDGDKGNANAAMDLAAVDLAVVESEMTNLLRKFPTKPDDWLHRTIEKNLRLGKKYLSKLDDCSGGVGILDEMRERVEARLDEDDEGEDGVNDGDDHGDDGTSMDVMNEARLRAEARTMGIDPDEAVAAARGEELVSREKDGGKGSEDDDRLESDGKEDDSEGDVVDSNKLSGASSLLLSLRRRSNSGDSDSLVLVALLCSIAYAILSLICGRAATVRAENVWKKVHEPAQRFRREAENLAEDERMRDSHHLWSESASRWIARDAAFFLPPASDDATAATLPPTVRWDPSRKRWDRWSKNLTTRTKASKKESSSSVATMTRGTFAPVRVGEGWVTAPEKPEVPNERIADSDIRFFACLPEKNGGGDDDDGGGGDSIIVVDVTSWAVAALMTKESARALGAVDSGRALFQFEVAAPTTEKIKKKGKGKKHQTQHHRTPDEEEQEAYMNRKGVGATARVCERYLD